MNKHRSGDCEWHSMTKAERKLAHDILRSRHIWDLRDTFEKHYKARVYLDRKIEGLKRAA